MTDPVVEAARTRWLPRILAQGVPLADATRTLEEIERWADWLDAWVATGATHEALARTAEGRGRTVTAGEAYVRAAVCYHFAKFTWLEDLAKYRAATERSVVALRSGLRLVDPTFERIEIPFGADRIVANLRRPPAVDRAPFVILVPGLDSTKEEFTAWEGSFLDRGLATVSLDGPGQGEAGFASRIRPDYETPVAALLDALGRRDDLDLGRVGISGLGMGGYYALRAAAFEPRITAAGVVGGAYRFERMPDIVRRKFMHGAGLDDLEEARRYSAGFTLDGIIEKVRQPILVIHGGLDAVMTAEVAERTARAAPRGEFVLYPEGNTVCFTVTRYYRPFLADWLAERI
jgi:2,6-dihydroxypseudooxynicotine hydrolase